MKKLFFLIISIVTMSWLGVEKASAQTDFWGINQLSGLALGSRTIGDTIAGIINVVLGFLGIIAVALILYAGFLWMTSQGNADKVQRAKMIMISAVIGLAIVVSAFVIARFILTSLGEATGGPGGGPGGPVIVIPGTTACPAPEDGTTVVVCNPNPNANTVGSYFSIGAWNIGDYVDAATSRVELSGVATGPAELARCAGTASWTYQGTNTYGDNYYQIVAIVPNLTIASGYTVNLYNGGPANPSLGTFEILAGTANPSISCIDPSAGPATGVTGNPADLITIEGVGFGPAPEQIFMHAWVGGIEDTAYIVPLTNIDSWAEDQITFYVPDEALTGQVRIHVGTETSNPWNFTVTCSGPGDCDSGCCPAAAGACYASAICFASSGAPVISAITPDNAAANDQNIVTIYGSGFGAYVPGLSQVNFAGGVVGVEPSTVNAHCTNFWNDNYITIVVPTGAVTGGVTVSNGSGLTSNGYTFTVNGVDRPGLCAVTQDIVGIVPMTQGYFGDTAYLWGLGLNSPAGDTYFGDFMSPVSSPLSDEQVETEVPNILGNLGITYRNGEQSNPLPYTVLPGTSGAPIINEIVANEVLANSGPTGQYITVSGANFGNVAGNLIFRSDASGVDYDADFSFPAQCQNNIWRHDTIIAKVPAAAGNVGAFSVRVERVDSQTSNNYPFTKTTGLPGPGLCAMLPSNGPASMEVDLYGDNFGLTPGVNGQVEFYNGVSGGTGTIWNNSQILNVPVPTTAQSGPVVVYNDTNPNPSNPLTFNVGSCSVNSDCTALGYTTCCADSFSGNYCADTCGPVINQCSYGWTFTTESALSIVDRGPVCADACIGAIIWANFDSEIAAAFMNDSHFSIYSCGGDASCASPDMTNNLVAASMDASNQSGPFVNPTTGQNYWTVEIPNDPLTVGQYYMVSIDPNIENTLGAIMGPDPLASWNFGIGYDDCYINSVNITPLNPVAYLGTTVPYGATAYSAPGICYPTGMPLYCEGGHANPSFDCTWSWASDNAGIASIPNIDNASNIASANSIGSTNIRATATQGSAHVSPPSNITVINGPMTVVGWAPSCDNSCTNALTYIDFNHELGLGFFMSTYFEVNLCLNADCSLYGSNLVNSGSYVAPTVPNGPHRYYLQQAAGPIVYNANSRYRIFVSGVVEDIYGTTLGDNFLKTFSVGDGPCLIESVDLNPISASVYVGETAAWHAMGLSAPDACYPSGQPVTCVADPNPLYNCSWSWGSSDIGVATIPNVNNQSNTATAVGVGTSVISANADQGPGPGLISDTSSMIVNTHDNPEVYNALPTGIDACINGAISASFTEIMSRASVGSNLKLYRESTADVPGETCVFNGSWWCEVELGRMNFMDDQVLQDTSVIAYPRNFMASSTTHRAMIYGDTGGALSSYGMPLAGASMNYDIDGGGADGYSWTFDTGLEACDISHALIDPAWDIFFCSTSNCYGDSNPGMAGNQHEYTAFTYDIRGNLLTVDEHQWSIINGLLNNVPASTVVNSQIEATATNQNGVETLSVEVSDSRPEVAGTATAQSRIDLVMCEGPWPGYASFPWEPTTNLYNYSTFYCQDSGIEGDETLPFINPATNPTSPDPDGVLPNGEHIFLVQPPTSALSSDLANAGFGALAYNSGEEEDDIAFGDKWYQKLTRNILGIKKAEGQSEIIVGCTPSPGVNLHVVAADETHVYLDWQRPATAPIPTNYLVRRRIVGEAVWATVASGVVATEYNDTSVSPNVDYEYSIWSWYNGLSNPICTEPGGYMSPMGSNSVQIRTTSEQPTFDLIGIRVMGNEDHLSISDWYNKYAPNPEVAGALIEVDGYEALQVGNTTYVSASNISPGTAIWTNVYIISHNEGASMPTREIYSQMISNMKLNINVDQQNNTCAGDPTIACSSDFDCPVGDACNSRGLKLRRDTKRLADLVHVKNAVENYGQSHKSCSTAPGRSCVTDADCASVSGLCIPFYPILESGSFVNGLTTSNWPESWGTNFPNLLNVPVNSLPRDPIGLFNGCPDDTMPGGPADPNTCWNEIDQVFTCPLDSLTYLFNDLGSTGSDYTIGANFEYDMNPFGATFAADLAPVGVSAIPHLNASLDTWCNATTYSPGPVTNPLCGNGIPDAGEECDGGFRNLCDETLFPANWWNERLGGCNLPGTLGECLWYDPSPALTAAQCGGYCGNANIDAPYENCDAAAFDGLYTCYNPSSQTFENPTCDGSICQPLCPSTGLLAAACGDGYWDPDKEQCDESALPDGLAGWDCSDSGSASCNLCRIECTTGVVYGGECGDGTIDSPYEECEPISWLTPPAAQSSSTNEYLCHGDYCVTYGGFCGDGLTYDPALDFYQPEQCDYASYSMPLPRDSSEDRQYTCSDGTDFDPETGDLMPACTIGGGWCGDGYTFDASGASPLELNMNGGDPESCDDFDNEDTNACTNDCKWTCHLNEVGGIPDDDPIEDMLIGPSFLDQSEGLLFDNSYPTIDLYSGDSTTVNLRSCRVSGPLAVDVTIENNDSYAGIVFIIDRSGSMLTNDIPGYSSRMAATRDAIAGTEGVAPPGQNALDSILARNPSAQVALVSFASNVYTNSGFVNIAEEIDTLKSIVNGMGTIDCGVGCQTNHEGALARAKDILQAENFENNIVIFMTDGACTPSGSCEGPSLVQAEQIKLDPTVGIMGEIFTVALSPNNSTWAPIRGYMNAVSSSDCSYTNYGRNPVGECGGISYQGTNCYSYDSNDPTVTRPVWEQCDPQVDGANCYGPGAMDGGEYVECRWTPASTETNYFYAGQNLTLMYANISGSIPVNTVELGLTFIDTGSDSPPTSIITNGTYYIDTRDSGVNCAENNPIENLFSLHADFIGNPNAYLRLSNPRYLFCPWDN